LTLLDPAESPPGPSITIDPTTDTLPPSVIRSAVELSRFAW